MSGYQGPEFGRRGKRSARFGGALLSGADWSVNVDPPMNQADYTMLPNGGGLTPLEIGSCKLWHIFAEKPVTRVDLSSLAGVTWTDLSGNGYNAAATGGPLYYHGGINGYAVPLVYSSGTHYIAPWPFTQAQPFTQWCVINVGSSGADLYIKSGGTPRVTLSTSDNNALAGFGTTASTSGHYTAGKWMFVCLIYNGANSISYLNSSLIRSTAGSDTVSYTASTYLYGWGAGGGGGWEVGTMVAEQGMFSKALSLAEVRQLAAYLNSRYYPDLVIGGGPD